MILSIQSIVALLFPILIIHYYLLFFFLKLFKILFSIAKTSVVSICFVCSKVVPISNAMNITS